MGPYDGHLGFYRGRQNADQLDRLLYTDQKTYLVELLMKQDQMSMAASLESRVPFLDHKLVEFAARVPRKYKLRGMNGKYLLKQAMQNELPASILTREKMGFPVPIAEWLREGFRDVPRRVLLSERALSRGIFRPDYVRQLVAEHQSAKHDHSWQLWTLLNFEMWAALFIDNLTPQQLQDELFISAVPAFAESY